MAAIRFLLAVVVPLVYLSIRQSEIIGKFLDHWHIPDGFLLQHIQEESFLLLAQQLALSAGAGACGLARFLE